MWGDLWRVPKKPESWGKERIYCWLASFCKLPLLGKASNHHGNMVHLIKKMFWTFGLCSWGCPSDRGMWLWQLIIQRLRGENVVEIPPCLRFAPRHNAGLRRNAGLCVRHNDGICSHVPFCTRGRNVWDWRRQRASATKLSKWTFERKLIIHLQQRTPNDRCFSSFLHECLIMSQVLKRCLISNRLQPSCLHQRRLSRFTTSGADG